MAYISKCLYSVFEFAAYTNSVSFDKDEWLDYLKKEEARLSISRKDGEWIFKFYDRNAGNGSELRQAVKTLFFLEKPRKRKIYEAIRHDMKFAKDTSGSFSFETIKLTDEEQKIIKDFFLYFYKVRLYTKNGFRLEGLTENSFERKKFAAKYFNGKNERLKHICPVCLMPTTNAEKEHDVEHYFSKTFVSCLGLHPDNLYFSCKVCNQTYKDEKKYSDKQITDIRQIFLPYVDTVRDKIKIKVEHETGCDSICFEPADPNEEYIEKKIETFDYFYNLKERWSGMLESYHQELSNQYKNEIEDLQDDKGIFKDETFFRKMNDDLQKKKRSMLEEPACYIKTQYTEWLCQKDSGQFRAFCSNLAQNGREAKII